MPYYRFNVMGVADQGGTQLSSPLYERREGMRLLGALIAGEEITPLSGEPCLEITDGTGAVLFRLSVVTSDMLEERAA